MKQLSTVIVILALVISVLLWKRKEVIRMIGVVDTLPAILASQDGVNIEVESLARVGMSEESSTEGRTAVMWAAKNEALHRGITITFLVTTAKHHKPGEAAVTEEYDGLYTRDLPGKFCSTYQTPDAETLSLAQNVYDGTISDPTSGARHWLSFPAWGGRTQEAFEAEGLSEIEVPGVTKTRFWG